MPDPMQTPPIIPPAMIGIVGSGIMAHDLVIAARSAGYRTTVLDPDHSSRAGAIADVHVVAGLDDAGAHEQLGRTCAVVTVVGVAAPESMRRIADHTAVRPSPSVIATCQDRIAQKRFLDDIGVAVGPWRAIESVDDIAVARGDVYPAVLGPSLCGDRPDERRRVQGFDDLAATWDALDHVPCVLEPRRMTARELSMVVARATDGRTATYAVAQHTRTSGIIDITHVPAILPEGGHSDAAELCTYIADELDLVGVLGVGLVVVGRDVLVDRLVPHVSEIGHFTLGACATSQFEQHLRAVCGLGLGDTSLGAKGAATATLLDHLWSNGEPDWSVVLGEPSAHLHLYGTTRSRPGEPAGHLLVTTASALGAASLAKRLRTRLTT